MTSCRSVLIIIAGLVVTLLAALGFRKYYQHDACGQIWCYPVYVPLPFTSPNSLLSDKYRLFLYREGGTSPLFETPDDSPNLGGTPVLFVPGNAGSYEQGRSLASLAASWPSMDWFLTDFEEDFSALHGKTVVDETAFVNDAIRYILGLYRGRDNRPTSVIVVGHSMGGIVARALPALDNYVPESVNTIITLSTPHVYAPLTFDRDLTQLYDKINRWWRHGNSANVSLLSVAGGHSDLLVLPDMTIVESLGGLTAFSYEIPQVGLGIDHLAIVWCSELRHMIVETLAAVLRPDVGARTLPFANRMEVFEQRLKRTPSPAQHQVEISRSILVGKSASVIVQGRTDIVLPAQSSLFSFDISAGKPLSLSHRATNEYRDYGITKNETIMWYSQGPYVPFTQNNRLVLQVEPMNENERITVTIRVNWLATLSNVAIHYRTLGACWPLGIALIALTKSIAQKVPFGVALDMAIRCGTLPLTAALAFAHIALSFAPIRNALRSLQIPREGVNLAAIRENGFDVHDLLLGTSDIELVWVVPLLLTIATAAVLLIYVLTFCVVTSLERVFGRSPPRLVLPLVVQLAILVPVLYVVPYQVATVGIAVISLFRVRNTQSLGFGFVQVLLWTAALDAPIIGVWARNFNVEWTWAFSSWRHVFSALPIALFTLRYAQITSIPPGGIQRRLTYAIIGYTAAYAFLFGGLHAFMLPHFVNYLAAWLIIARDDDWRQWTPVRSRNINEVKDEQQ